METVRISSLFNKIFCNLRRHKQSNNYYFPLLLVLSDVPPLEDLSEMIDQIKILRNEGSHVHQSLVMESSLKSDEQVKTFQTSISKVIMIFFKPRCGYLCSIFGGCFMKIDNIIVPLPFLFNNNDKLLVFSSSSFFFQEQKSTQRGNTFGGFKKGFLNNPKVTRGKPSLSSRSLRNDNDIPVLKPKNPMEKNREMEIPEVQEAMKSNLENKGYKYDYYTLIPCFLKLYFQYLSCRAVK